jgi:predicted DNA-binding transcriptional regulator AlpA
MKNETIKTVTDLAKAAIKDPAELEKVIERLQTPTTPKALPDKMLKTREAAALAGCTRHTLRNWERQGYLHPRHITASRVRWSKRELEKFLCETVEA